MKPDLIVDCNNTHGEGVLWDVATRLVWWTDIHGQALWWYDAEANRSGSYAMPRRLCAFAPRRSGGWIMAFADGVELWSVNFTSERRICDFEPDNPLTRLNDGRTDRQGRFVVGGMNEGSGAHDSSVIRIDAEGKVETLFGGVSCANSTCFSPDGSLMYFADTPARNLLVYPYGDVIGTPRVLASLHAESGMPDGSCTDSEGGVWNAEWQGGQVIRMNPSGQITHRISLPVPKVTCCAFGGDDLDTLYITTSRLGDAEAVRGAGGLYALKPGFHGVADTPFNG